MYVPTPPVPVPSAVTIVFEPTPLMSEKRAIDPDEMVDTVSVVPEMEPVNTAEPVPTGQKKPAVHVPVDAVAPHAQ